ncbi:MAG: glycosyltransferase [Bacteroidota bacterium]
MKQNIIENKDFVIVCAQPWSIEIGTNIRNIAKIFSHANRVLYVNPPLDRITAFKERGSSEVIKMKQILKGKADSLIQVQQNIWTFYPTCMTESINWISNPAIFDFLNKINNKRFADSIAIAIEKLNFKDVVLFIDNYFIKSLYLQELLKPSLSVYYSRDYLIGIPYWKRHGKRLEPLMIEKSDMAVANSSFLKNYLHQYNSNAFYVGQGCDLQKFNEGLIQELPPEFNGLKSPIIGYVGALTSLRLDIDLLFRLAHTKRDWNFVLVGQEDEAFQASVLHHLDNIYFLGPRNISQVPAYIKGFDVCINPQLINEITIGNYPLKVDEYLAMGKPVVATKTLAMESFAAYVYLADGFEEYVDLIERAIRENSLQLTRERKAFAATHSWENSVTEIYKAINQVKVL